MSCSLLEVLGAAPGRRQEPDIRHPRHLWHHLQHVTHDELDSILNPIDLGVFPGEPDFLRIYVDSNDVVTRLSELNGVAADATKGVDNDVTATPLRNVLGDGFRCNREPRLVVKLDSLVEPTEQVVPLNP